MAVCNNKRICTAVHASAQADKAPERHFCAIFLHAVVVASVHQQLMASSNNTKVVGMLRFNIDGEVDSTRVVGAQWVPGHAGQYFVVGHLSGRVYLYRKVRRKCPAHT